MQKKVANLFQEVNVCSLLEKISNIFR